MRKVAVLTFLEDFYLYSSLSFSSLNLPQSKGTMGVILLQMKEIKPRMTYCFAPGPRATPQPLFSASWEMQRCWENRGGNVLSAPKIHFLGQSGSFGKYKDSLGFQQALPSGVSL